jgi:hypothetical protein
METGNTTERALEVGRDCFLEHSEGTRAGLLFLGWSRPPQSEEKKVKECQERRKSQPCSSASSSERGNLKSSARAQLSPISHMLWSSWPSNMPYPQARLHIISLTVVDARHWLTQLRLLLGVTLCCLDHSCCRWSTDLYLGREPAKSTSHQQASSRLNIRSCQGQWRSNTSNLEPFTLVARFWRSSFDLSALFALDSVHMRSTMPSNGSTLL